MNKINGGSSSAWNAKAYARVGVWICLFASAFTITVCQACASRREDWWLRWIAFALVKSKVLLQIKQQVNKP